MWHVGGILKIFSRSLMKTGSPTIGSGPPGLISSGGGGGGAMSMRSGLRILSCCEYENGREQEVKKRTKVMGGWFCKPEMSMVED